MQENFNNDNILPLEYQKQKLIENDSFVTNKRPYGLDRGKYSNLFSAENQFISSKIDKFYFGYSLREIIISSIFSITFYLLFIDLLLSQKTITIVLFPITYILGQIIQGGILHEPIYYSRQDFFKEMEKILNLSVTISLKSVRINNAFHFKGKFTNDVSGNINIPKSINLIKIGNFQYFIDEKYYQEFNEWKLDIKTIPKIDYYKGSIIYNLNSNYKTPPYNIITLILSIFLLQWINALIFRFVSVEDIVTIFPAKLITVNPKDDHYSPTSIVIHGNSLNIPKNITNSVNESEYDNKINFLIRDENERKEKEKEERQEKLDRKKNTSTLSVFEDNHFYIRVRKEYDDVYLNLKVYDVIVKGKRRDATYENIYLGPYDENIIEDKQEEDYPLLWTYTPKGIDIKIKVKKKSGCFSIFIGDIFHETFYL